MPFDPYELSFIGLTIFAFLYGFFGFNQPSIFEEIASHKGIAPDASGEEDGKYARSGLKLEDVKQIRQQVLNYMEEKKPYLDRELTINDVAADLGIPRHFITEVINQHIGKNFYYLINEYRVEEVKRRLKDPKYKNLTILAIAYDSGFNSKSAFNTIFKDLTGMTPSQYLDSAAK
jgi:AraC-like DNA-binding protein